MTVQSLTRKLLRTLQVAIATMQSSGNQGDSQTLDEMGFEEFFEKNRGGDKPELPDDYQRFGFLNGVYSCLQCRTPAQFEKVEAGQANRLIARPRPKPCHHN